MTPWVILIGSIASIFAGWYLEKIISDFIARYQGERERKAAQDSKEDSQQQNQDENAQHDKHRDIEDSFDSEPIK